MKPSLALLIIVVCMSCKKANEANPEDAQVFMDSVAADFLIHKV